MNTKRGYRLKLESLKDLSSFMEDFRGAATKVLARKWTTDVAARAAEACDFAGLGLTAPTGDVIRAACNELNLKLASSDMAKHAYNCAIDFYFVESAVLAIFNHGDKDYQEVWRRKRVVEHWGWARDVERPGTISEKQWQLRERVWTALSKRPRFGLTLNFQLLSTPLPVVTPRQVVPLLPTYEARVGSAVAALLAQEGKKLKSVSDHELQKLKEHVTRRLVTELTPDHLLGTVPVAPPPQASAQKLKSPIAELRASPKPQSKKADSIDHADIVLSSDGRTFIAVPNVGLADNSRVFIHVGTKDVVFIQDGVNFGTVTEVPEAAREHLKFCKEAVLVEVEKSGEGRLLRARYVAIVTDISFTENQRQSMIVGFKRPTRSSAASREFEEWEKNSQSQ
jgi:hypothetical protein